MTTLTYRGKNYVQIKESFNQDFVELTYRRNVYQNRKQESSSKNNKTIFTYRGVNYQN